MTERAVSKPRKTMSSSVPHSCLNFSFDLFSCLFLPLLVFLYSPFFATFSTLQSLLSPFFSFNLPFTYSVFHILFFSLHYDLPSNSCIFLSFDLSFLLPYYTNFSLNVLPFLLISSLLFHVFLYSSSVSPSSSSYFAFRVVR